MSDPIVNTAGKQLLKQAVGQCYSDETSGSHTPHSVRGLSSLNRDQARATPVKAPSPNHWTDPLKLFLKVQLLSVTGNDEDKW